MTFYPGVKCPKCSSHEWVAQKAEGAFSEAVYFYCIRCNGYGSAFARHDISIQLFKRHKRELEVELEETNQAIKDWVDKGVEYL